MRGWHVVRSRSKTCAPANGSTSWPAGPLDFVLRHARDDEPEEVKWESAGSGRPAGTSNAPPWVRIARPPSISTAVARTRSSPIMKTKSPSLKAHTSAGSSITGCTTVVRVDDEKMSKSLGNFFTIREVLKKYDAEVLRFFILRAHYRSPLNYSDVHLDDARQA
jgi:cysteinyl-tRNA synthetase